MYTQNDIIYLFKLSLHSNDYIYDVPVMTTKTRNPKPKPQQVEWKKCVLNDPFKRTHPLYLKIYNKLAVIITDDTKRVVAPAHKIYWKIFQGWTAYINGKNVFSIIFYMTVGAHLYTAVYQIYKEGVFISIY